MHRCATLVLSVLAVLAGCGDDADLLPSADAGRDAGVVTDGGGLDGATERDAGPEPLAVTIDNVADGEMLPHPLALLVGSVETAATEIRVGTGGASASWPIVDGRFKALVRLAPGANEVTLSAAERSVTVELTYVPQTNPRYVRLVYILASDGDGSFQAPEGEPNDQASAVARMRLAAEMLQAFLAESMVREGHGRWTFRLSRAPDGQPDVLIHRSSLSTSEALATDGLDLWYHFYDELGALPDRDDSIDVAVMAFTRYEASTMTLRGHTALGGGRLALFSSVSLHTWAEELEEVDTRFADESVIDGTMFHDDSAFRQRAWSNFATTLGATMHELGHCLSLPHPTSGSTIMSRGFDHINRWFVPWEPPSATTPGLATIAPSDEPGWHDGNAARLRYHRYLELLDVAHASDEPPTFRRESGRVVVSSANGLRQVAHHVNGDIAAFEHFPDAPPTEHIVDLAAARAAYGAGANLRVTAIDAEGNIGESDEAPL